MPKLIPPPSGIPLFVPDLDYNYFENHDAHPLQPEAPGFALVNAWWMAEMALLAYADHDFVKQELTKTSFSMEGDKPFSGKSTQCYVIQNDRLVILAFRGTEFRQPDELPKRWHDVASDWLADADFSLVEFDGGDGDVHQGFHKALNEVWTPLSATLQALRQAQPERPIWFTGHSLGGALAQLAAARFGRARAVYTFGSPQVGDHKFATQYRPTHYRVVNNNDGVAGTQLFGFYRVLPGFYEHTGELIYLDRNGLLQTDAGTLERLADGLLGNAEQLLEAALQFAGTRKLALPLDQLNDHIPTYYALHLWNNYETAMKQG